MLHEKLSKHIRRVKRLAGGGVYRQMAKGTVLVIDDDPTITELVADALQLDGYTVVQSAGSASLSLADQAQPGVILLDINMPDMDGVEVSRRLRSNPATAHIPIVIMSAAVPDMVSEQLVADAWLSKPFRLHQLYQAVRRWVPG